ncbi:hypothetical protein, partial [Thiolapillus sp.]|uniref:hypothetical protein n=1 Tax=Thiolapillus sp. TaxID=2017437 RepID=UPI003AF9DB9D
IMVHGYCWWLFDFVCIIIPEKASFSLHFNGLQLLSRFYIIYVLQQSTLLSFISHYLLLFG